MSRDATWGWNSAYLTAVYVARALRTDEVILIKDVDGIYSADPKEDGRAQYFDALTFAEARIIAGKLIQDAAIDAAERFGISIIIRSMLGDRESRIGPPSGAAGMLSECAA